MDLPGGSDARRRCGGRAQASRNQPRSVASGRPPGLWDHRPASAVTLGRDLPRLVGSISSHSRRSWLWLRLPKLSLGSRRLAAPLVVSRGQRQGGPGPPAVQPGGRGKGRACHPEGTAAGRGLTREPRAARGSLVVPRRTRPCPCSRGQHRIDSGARCPSPPKGWSLAIRAASPPAPDPGPHPALSAAVRPPLAPARALLSSQKPWSTQQTPALPQGLAETSRPRRKRCGRVGAVTLQRPG